MFKNILVPVALDHNEMHDKAVRIAKSLLDSDGVITVMNVLEDVPGWAGVAIPQGINDQTRQAAEAEVKRIAEAIGGNTIVAVIYGHAGRNIVSYSDERECDCVVVASHRPGLTDYFLGSTAAAVARHADACVMVVR